VSGCPAVERTVGDRPGKYRSAARGATSGDKIDDPSVAWASTNQITTLGTLTVASVVPDSQGTERALMFSPGLLPAGIEPADPMIQFRNKTYPVSYERRHQT
jgi:catalase